MDNFLNSIARYLSALLSLLLCLFVGLPDVVIQNKNERNKNIADQIARMQTLAEDYKKGNYTRVNETELAGFDVEKAYADGVRYNEVAFIATHNSYQLPGVPALQKIFTDLETVTFGLVDSSITSYCSDTLTGQFNVGIRSIELDVETVVDGDNVRFVCSHSPLLDMTSTCYDFELALEEIKMWSDANPHHLPITVIIEPKEFFLLENGMRFINLRYTNEIDRLLLEVFGDKLITPAEMMGDYASLKEMREADNWLSLEECAGKVVALLHDTDGVTKKYIRQDESIKTQAMFPMLRYKDRDKSYASFLIVNKPKDIAKNAQELIFEKNLVVRTRVDSYGSHNEEDRQLTLGSGAQILSTDYPPRADMNGVDYWVDFANGTAKVIK